MQTGLVNHIAVLMDLMAGCLYARVLFDAIFQKKINVVLKAPLFGALFCFSLYCIFRVFPADIALFAKIAAFRGYLYYVPMYLVGYFYYFSPKEFKRFTYFCASMLLILGLYACRQQFLGYTARELSWINWQITERNFTAITNNEIRVFSMQNSSLDFACLLALFIPMAIPWIFSTPRKRQRLCLLGIIFIAIVSAFTFIRAAFVAWSLSALLVCMLLWWSGYINHKNLWKILGIGSLVCVVLFFSFNVLSFNNNKNLNVILARIQSVGSLTSLPGIIQQSTRARAELVSMQSRVNIWRTLIADVQNGLIGNGVGALRNINPINIGQHNPRALAENMYVYIYYELGVVGLLFFLSIFSGYLRFYFQHIRQSPLLCIMPIGLIVSLLIVLLAGDYLATAPIRVTSWFFFGVFCRKITEGDRL
ncbi:MAG: O-antigen ligase family protein [Candidatus Margulisbacteria bacterium]|nr:O-antigen ligase family protein [Candidatus Margulisiibacteriota bacterium]